MEQPSIFQEETYLGTYRLVSKLGQGAMGRIYKGYDPSFSRYVALKTVNPHILALHDAAQTGYLERFRQEAKILGHLNHPNIVSVYGYGQDRNTTYIAMEFIPGRTLYQILHRRKKFGPLSGLLKLMVQLLDALKYCHDRGIIHTDIKPANIMVTPRGDMKLTDFGTARTGYWQPAQAVTALGTPSYMSPEMVGHKRVDARTDLFSSGVLFYHCLVGKKPFEGSADQVMDRILNQPHTPPSVVDPDIHPELDRVIGKALAKDPEDRYPDAAAMRMDLTQLKDQI